MPTAWVKPTSQTGRASPRPPRDGVGPGQPMRSVHSSAAHPRDGPPKSKAVKALENIKEKLLLVSSEEKRKKDPTGGCFCLAQVHKVSPYTPLCRTCGLVLCLVNSPHFLCPHCSAELLTPQQISSTVQKIDIEISRVVKDEEDARKHAAEEARRTTESFPTLMGGGSGVSLQLHPTAAHISRTPSPSQQQQHKVLSLNSKTKKATVTTYTKRPVTPSFQAEDSEKEPEIVRIAPPQARMQTKDLRYLRRWQDPRVEAVTYVPLPTTKEPMVEKQGQKRRKAKVHGADAAQPGPSTQP